MADISNAGPATRLDHVPSRVLRGNRSNRVIAGMSGGVGRYLGVGPVITRVAWVLSTLAGGTGVLLYVIGWLAHRTRTRAAPKLAPQVHRRPWSWGVLVAVGALLALRDALPGRDRFVRPIAIVALGPGLTAGFDHPDARRARHNGIQRALKAAERLRAAAGVPRSIGRSTRP
jgi:phage shock protein PspC (stress-responsive transcriptional regulator)